MCKFLYIYDTYLKIEYNARYRNKVIYICVGINSNDFREISASRLYDPETEMQWELFFDFLKNRGLNGVGMVISDAKKGVRAVLSCILYEGT